MTDRLARATEFELLEQYYPRYGQVAGGVTIQRRRDRYGDVRWAVMLRGYALNHAGDLEWEPLPSSRDDAYLERTRWETLDAAWEAAEALAARCLAEEPRKPGDTLYA